MQTEVFTLHFFYIVHGAYCVQELCTMYIVHVVRFSNLKNTVRSIVYMFCMRELCTWYMLYRFSIFFKSLKYIPASWMKWMIKQINRTWIIYILSFNQLSNVSNTYHLSKIGCIEIFFSFFYLSFKVRQKKNNTTVIWKKE